MTARPSFVVLPDCAACGSPVVPDVDDNLRAVDRCTGCGITQATQPVRINRRDLREQIGTVLEVRPRFCDSCLRRRCTACVDAGCQCPRPLLHRQRPAGDVTPAGLALVAAETAGHLDPTEV